MTEQRKRDDPFSQQNMDELEALLEPLPEREERGSHGAKRCPGKSNMGPGRGPGRGPDGDDDPFKDVTLDSVGGLEPQIAWLNQCILKPLQSSNMDYSWGVKPPKGVLFYGPPGTGKTLLARAFGNELSKNLKKPVKFFHRKGGDCFSMWFGESSQNLRTLFQEAIAAKPSILFFDELDGLCPSRDGPHGGEAYNTVVTTLLGLMDTLPVGEVFVFGATNRVNAVDAAMLRPGRFDKHLEFFPPNLDARKRIIGINTAKWKRSQPTGQHLDRLGEMTVGFSGADLHKLCMEAFDAAFARHIPDLSAENTKSLDDMEILEGDWKVALANTKPTDMAVFGSTQYIPRLPDSTVNPLISNIHKEIVARLLPFLPRRSQAQMDLAEDRDSSATVSTFLLTNQSPVDVDVMESMILSGVLIHPQVAEYPVYMLSEENILSEHLTRQLSYVTETIHQAINSVKPCILYLPRLDALAAGSLAPFIAEQVLQLGGKSVLVLATSSRPRSELPHEHGFRTIFGGKDSNMAVRLPLLPERTAFFRPLFGNMGLSADSKAPAVTPGIRKKLNELHVEAARATEGDDVELILCLYDALANTFAKYFDKPNKKPLLKELSESLNEYRRTKFQI